MTERGRRVRDFFRFSIRQFLVLVVFFSVCVAVNRRNDFASLDRSDLTLALLGVVVLAVLGPSILLILVLAGRFR